MLATRRRTATVAAALRGAAVGWRGAGGDGGSSSSSGSGGSNGQRLRSLLLTAVLATLSIVGALRLTSTVMPWLSSPAEVTMTLSAATAEAAEARAIEMARAKAAEGETLAQALQSTEAAAAAGEGGGGSTSLPAQAVSAAQSSPAAVVADVQDVSGNSDSVQSQSLAGGTAAGGVQLPFHVRLAESYNAGKAPEDFQLNQDEDGVLLITFATKSASEFLQNWFMHVQNAGIEPYVVGALDEDIVTLCETKNIPVVLVNGSEILRQRQANFFSIQSSDFRKYSAVKTAFILSLLERGITPIMSDADVIWLRNPKEYFQRGALATADILVSSDCVNIPADKKDDGSCAQKSFTKAKSSDTGCWRWAEQHINFNTGIMVIRPSPATISFAKEWNNKIITSTEHWMRDQPAFNLITREDTDIGRLWGESPVAKPRRVFPVGGNVTLASLPNWLFTNGHTCFVQEARKYSVEEEVYSIHMTFQHGDSFTYAYGKRQRLRENGLFLVESDEYYTEGNFLSISDEGTTYPVHHIDSSAHSRVGYYYHDREDHLRRMWCYCDNMWANLVSCRTPGSEAMHLPFSCPMDHIFNPQSWFADTDIRFRENFFMKNPRVPDAIRNSVAYIRVQSDMAPNRFDNSTRKSLMTLNSQLAAEDIVELLKKFDDYRLVELSSAVDLVKGLKGDGTKTSEQATAEMNKKLDPLITKKNFFCFTEDWEAMGKPRKIPWEHDVVKRDCGITEQEMLKAGRIHYGKIMNYSDCGCEWGFGNPDPLVPMSHSSSPTQG